MNRYQFFFLFFLLSFTLVAKSVSWRVAGDKSTLNAQCSEIEAYVPHEMFLITATYESDIYISPEEFSYLTSLQNGSVVDATHLIHALHCLHAKNRFASIALQVTEEHNQLQLHFIFESFWLLNSITIKGLLVNRQQYQNSYLMAPGEPFDKDKHRHSCTHIKQLLANQGYYNATVASSIKRDYKNKLVSIFFTIKRGRAFVIDRITIDIKAPTLTAHEQTQLTKKLRYALTKELSAVSYTKELINQTTRSLKQLLAQNGFLQSTITLQETINHKDALLDLSFTADLPHKKQCIFVGNSFFSNKQLFENIIRYGKTTWLLPARIIAHEVERMYHDAGFMQVAVEAYDDVDKSFFIINEGKRTVISVVELEGTSHFSAPELIARFFKPVIKKKYPTRSVIQKACERLVAFYSNHGFWDAHITKIQYVPLPEKTSYTLLITFNEGQQIQLGSTVIHGLPPDQEITLPSADTPQFLHPGLIDEQQKYILESLRTLGHDPHCSPTFERNNNSVVIHWRVSYQKSDRVFGKTIIQSHTKIPFHSMVGELTYQPTSLFCHQEIKHSLTRLRDLDLFSHIKLTPTSLNSLAPDNVMILSLHDAPACEIRTRAGLALCNIASLTTGGGITYTVGGNFIHRNTLAYGDQLACNFDISRSSQLAEVQYRNPWLLRLPFRTTLQGYINRYIQPGISDELRQLYRANQKGALINFRHRWRHCITDCSLSVDSTTISLCTHSPESSRALAQALNFSPELIGIALPTCIIEPTFFTNYLDDPVEPRHGSLSLIAAKIAIPLTSWAKDIFFIKVHGEQSFFIPLAPRVIASINGKVGHIFTSGQLKQILPPERFYLGGGHSIRSYAPDMAPPLGVFTDLKHKKHLVAQGGLSFFSITTELRFLLYKNIWLTLFQDLGALSTTKHSFFARDVLLATGIGIWYSTPIGPIRFQLGYNWNKHTSLCPSYAWFLTIGNLF